MICPGTQFVTAVNAAKSQTPCAGRLPVQQGYAASWLRLQQSSRSRPLEPHSDQADSRAVLPETQRQQA